MHAPSKAQWSSESASNVVGVHLHVAGLRKDPESCISV